MAKEIIRTVCEGCMSGCGVLVHRENGKVTGIVGDPDHPQNRGRDGRTPSGAFFFDMG